VNGYQLTFARSARKELEALPASVVARVFPRIEALAVNFVPSVLASCEGRKTFGAFVSGSIG